jgi:hypothetical protein
MPRPREGLGGRAWGPMARQGPGVGNLTQVSPQGSVDRPGQGPGLIG